MKKTIAFVVILSLLLFMACDLDVDESGNQVVTVTIGFTMSLTGNYDLLSGRQVDGLMLWMNQVNAVGGIELSDGTRIRFVFVAYDDESNKDNVQDLYTQLVTEDRVDFLFSPYSSAFTDEAAVVADEYDKLMITAGAASDETHAKGYTTIFQTYTPASRYLTGAVDLLAHLDASLKKIAYVYENLEYSTIVAESARTYAEGLGFETVLDETYEPGTNDFAAHIANIEANGAEAVLGGGHFQDGSDFAQQLHDSSTAIDFLALLVAPPEPEFADIGEAAEGVIGPSQWEPSVTFTPEAANTADLEWFGPSGADFVDDYMDIYGEEPSYHSMGGYAAGLILEKAIIDANSIRLEDVVAALQAMNILTCYGRIQFDTTLQNHGLQIGHDMVYIQWQDKGGTLVKEVVWPLEGATAEAVYPLP